MKMNADVVRQFLNVFNEFLTLCSTDSWPNDATNSSEIRNAYETAKFVENCLIKLHSKNAVDAFLSQLKEIEGNVKRCLTDPPLFLLKKIISSAVDISVVDLAFTVFIEAFSEKRLEDYLAGLMLEKSSEEVILASFLKDASKDDLMKFKCDLLLAVSSDKEDTDISSILHEGDEELVNIILTCLTICSSKHQKELDKIRTQVVQIMSDKTATYQLFWKLLLIKLNKQLLIKLCCDNADIFSSVAKALIDSGKVIKENISAEYFYIDLTFSELLDVVKCLCRSEELRDDLINMVRLDSSEISFWDAVFSKV